MTDIPGMILWTDDYLGDTRHLTTFEHGAYLLILMAMWRNGGKLAKNSKKLALIAGAPMPQWMKIEKKIMDFMTIVEGSDGQEITQKRLRDEILNALARHQKKKLAGHLGGTAKALKNKGRIHSNATDVLHPLLYNYNYNIKKESFNGELRQESRWVPTKRIGGRLFKAGEFAPAYEGQPPSCWKKLEAKDCT